MCFQFRPALETHSRALHRRLKVTLQLLEGEAPGKGMRPYIPKTTDIPTSPALQSRYLETILQLLQMIPMKHWRKNHLLSVNFQVHIMYSFNFYKTFFLSCFSYLVPFLISLSLRREIALIFKEREEKSHRKDEGPYWKRSL